jgi:hypothetical protein
MQLVSNFVDNYAIWDNKCNDNVYFTKSCASKHLENYLSKISVQNSLNINITSGKK